MRTFPDDGSTPRDGSPTTSRDDERMVKEFLGPELADLYLMRPLAQITARGAVRRRRCATLSVAAVTAVIVAVGSTSALLLQPVNVASPVTASSSAPVTHGQSATSIASFHATSSRPCTAVNVGINCAPVSAASTMTTPASMLGINGGSTLSKSPSPADTRSSESARGSSTPTLGVTGGSTLSKSPSPTDTRSSEKITGSTAAMTSGNSAPTS